MNQEVKAMWVSALQSGEYQQGQCYLRVDDKYCCLGVLCDIYIQKVEGSWERNYDYEHSQVYNFAIESKSQLAVSQLTSSVMKWAGLENTDPRVVVNTLAVELMLSEVNDQGYSFNDIANIIENQL